MNSSRLLRVMRLIALVESGRAVSVDFLMSKLGISRRTLFRDMDILAEAGISCLFDRTLKRYVSDRALSSIVPLDETECFSLLLLFCQSGIPPFVESNPHLRQAISKVISAMPHHNREKSFKLLRQCHPDSHNSIISRELEFLLDN